MKTKSQAYKEPKVLVEARNVVRSLKFGTNEWEAAMQIVRDLVQAEKAVKQALRQPSDSNVSIGEYGEVTRYDGRTTQIQ